jgi:hypothetical protein
MPKPFRVKRNGKYIGSWIVAVGGERLNLRTKDAGEARRRARLAARGVWPPEEAAADAVADVLDGSAPDSLNSAPGFASVDPARTGRSGTPQAEPDTSPAPPAGSVTDAPPPVAEDPTAAANAAAADAAAADADAGLAGEFRDALDGEGVDLSDLKTNLPGMLAGVHLYVQGQACRFAVSVLKGGRWPSMVTLDESSKLRELLGKLWVVQLAKWDIRPENWTPLTLLLALSAVTASAQVSTMLAELSGDSAPKPERVEV